MADLFELSEKLIDRGVGEAPLARGVFNQAEIQSKAIFRKD